MNTSEYEFLESIFGNLGDALQEKMQRIDELEAENARLRHEVAKLRQERVTSPAPQNPDAAIKSVVLGQRFHNG